MEDLLALAGKALEYIPDKVAIGLGSGHTIEPFFKVLGERIRDGFQVRGVPSSNQTAELAVQFGIPLTSLAIDPSLYITVDGADEVEAPSLNLIKGWGGALVRERIIAAASSRQIILITEEKLVERLGSRHRLPVEVLPFAAEYCRRRLEAFPVKMCPNLRGGAGNPFITDNGNWIFDCAIKELKDAGGLEKALLAIPGVIDTGLFLGTADVILLAKGGSIQELKKRH